MAFVVTCSQLGCDLLKKRGDDAKATGTSAAADGLPPECADYLAVFRCVHVKSGEPNVDAQVDGLRDGFKAVATNAGAAAAKKQCVDLMTASQDGFAKVGCTKGVVATATPAQSPSVAAPRRPVPTTTAGAALLG